MRFHLAALPGQPIVRENGPCAFTQKVRKFGDMMVPRGHEVIIYGDERYEGVAEHVACYPLVDPPEFTAQAWMPYNTRVVEEIRERMSPGDVLGLMGGNCQASVLHALPELFPVEYGIGYGGCFAPFKVFESYAWMHTCYGEQRGSNTADGSFFDAVIEPYFELEDFPAGESGDYLLYVGRLTERKGIHIACEAAKRLGMRLVLAGAGEFEPDYGECVGVVGPEERGELMRNAKALLYPTIYVEPGGHAAIEAQLCGTPVISTDWGCFSESVVQGVSGYRCRTLGEFMWAVENVDALDRKRIRDEARAKYSYEAIGKKYDQFFERLMLLNDAGWYDETKKCPIV